MDSYEILATLEVPTSMYSYKLNRDGTRNIDKDHFVTATLRFKFDIEAFEQILFRDGPKELKVDDKHMYFDYKDNVLQSIHFESEDHIWIVQDLAEFMKNCKEIYNRLSLGIFAIGDIVRTPVYNPGEEIDEFEFENGIFETRKG